MIRLMLVDDHAMLREGLRDKFKDCGDVECAGEASTAAGLLSSLDSVKPAVVILDLKLPDANGVTLIRQIKDKLPECRVVVLTMYDHPRYASHALESGADGFVVKGAPFEELLTAIRTVTDGRTFVSPSLESKLVARLKGRKRKGSLESLSEREFQVLILIGNGLAVKEIAYQLGLSEKSITTYRARLMEKLQLPNRADLIRFAIEAGLVE